MKDRRSEWCGDPLMHRSRRSRSPLMSYKRQQRPQMRPYRSSGRRSASRERRQDHPLRRSDHGKELVHNHPPFSQHCYRSPSPLPSSHDDGFRFQHNYILPEHTTFNPSWMTSQSIKDGEFHSQINEAFPPSSLDTEEQGMQPQKSTFIGEQRSSRSLYLDHPMGSTVLSSDRMRRSGNGIGIGIQEVEKHSYNDGLRDPHDVMDRRHIHSRDLFIPKLPSSHLMRPFSSTSSSSILKEEVKGLHHSPISDGLASGINRYPNYPLKHYAFNQVPKPDLQDEPRINDFDELQPRGLVDHRHRIQDEPYKKMSCASRTEFRNPTSSTILDYPGDWMDKDDSTNRNLIQRTFSERHHYLHGDVTHDYDDVRARQELLTYPDNWHGGFRIKSSRNYESIPFEEGFESEKDFYPISHRAENRNSKPLSSNHDLDEHRLSMNAHDRSLMDDLGDYDVERMERINYSKFEDIDHNDSQVVLMNDRHFLAPYERDEMWPTEEPVEPSPSKSRLMEHSRHRKFSHGISTSLSSGASSLHAKSDLNSNLKKRLKHTRSDFHTSCFPERRRDLLRSFKYSKRGIQDRLGTQGRGTHDSVTRVVKNDPSEDSEEFKQQVHKAFLRYSKLLNESQHNRRMYQIQGSTCILQCSVCGSNSKEFSDTNSLVTHSYHSLKVGLKTEHLGFHKAICVLLGWNWRVPPDNSRAYQSMPVAEAKAMRDDLIVWPPLVIIHNILIGDESSTMDAKVTVESLEKILRDMGLGAGRIRVCLGKPANQSIFSAKFTPTFSGLQAAERLHKRFADRAKGKSEFHRISSHGKKNGEGQPEQADELPFLYGYIAVAEDLDKLDPETKKRSLLKSKKDDIEAIADATLNAD